MHWTPVLAPTFAVIVLAGASGAVPAGPFATEAAPADSCGSIRTDTVALDITFDVDSTNVAAAVGMAIQLPVMTDTSIVLQLPSSDAGRSNLYENVLDLHATTRSARIVPTERPDRWRLVAARGDTPTIAWRLRATSRSYSSDDAHNHSDIGPGWAQIIGYDALVLPALGPAKPVRATLHFHGIPHDGVIATSFGGIGRDSSIIASAALTDLRHAVYVLAIGSGAIRATQTDVRGGGLTVVVRGRHAIDDSTIVARVQRVMLEERAFWHGSVPSQYLVTIGVAPRGSLDGVQLVNAFVADIDSTRRMDAGVTGLFAHELMHEWIGRQLHPACTVPNGQLLWFTEGFDDFMAHRVMHDAWLLTDADYTAAIDRDLARHARSSARDSSWDAVVRRFWSDAASYQDAYARGELIALALNTQLIRATHGAVGLDSVLRDMASDSTLRRTGLTADAITERVGKFVGVNAARETIQRMLAGGAITLPDSAKR